jgi:hypothetical protein
VQPICRTHGLQTASGAPVQAVADPRFAAKLRDIIGRYVDLPAHAVVFSVD